MGHFRNAVHSLPIAVDRTVSEPLTSQIVGQFVRAIQRGSVGRGDRLPSSRALGRALGVARNTVLTAYDELKARGLIRGRRGAGMRVMVAASTMAFDMQRVMREAHYPARVITLRDQDGNRLRVSY